MLLLLCWIAICAHYFGDYNTIKGTWLEQVAVYGCTFSAMAYCVNIFVPPVKLIKHDNAFLSFVRSINWILWGLRLVKIFSGYFFVAIFLVPILFYVFWSCYTAGDVEKLELWRTLKTDPDFGPYALAGFCFWWLTLILRLRKISKISIL